MGSNWTLHHVCCLFEAFTHAKIETWSECYTCCSYHPLKRSVEIGTYASRREFPASLFGLSVCIVFVLVSLICNMNRFLENDIRMCIYVHIYSPTVFVVSLKLWMESRYPIWRIAEKAPMLSDFYRQEKECYAIFTCEMHLLRTEQSGDKVLRHSIHREGVV
jgi:hypothetical protein